MKSVCRGFSLSYKKKSYKSANWCVNFLEQCIMRSSHTAFNITLLETPNKGFACLCTITK